MNKVAIFADVQNIYYTTRDIFSKPLNYKAVWQEISQQGIITQAHAYAIERDSIQQKKFQKALENIGFKIHLKPFISRSDGSSKGDWDVGITIDVLETSASVDTIVLLSGDGDFDMLVKHIQQKYQVKVIVYGVEALTADSLKSACNEFRAIQKNHLN